MDGCQEVYGDGDWLRAGLGRVMGLMAVAKSKWREARLVALAVGVRELLGLSWIPCSIRVAVPGSKLGSSTGTCEAVGCPCHIVDLGCGDVVTLCVVDSGILDLVPTTVRTPSSNSER